MENDIELRKWCVEIVLNHFDDLDVDEVVSMATDIYEFLTKKKDEE